MARFSRINLPQAALYVKFGPIESKLTSLRHLSSMSVHLCRPRTAQTSQVRAMDVPQKSFGLLPHEFWPPPMPEACDRPRFILNQTKDTASATHP
ncbi:MAG: hypothetical protein DWI24_07325 [Planctomycetota bacterium]|nr:MAG: hypothetical protein DWI24_07325 [Planctomycetota bacterium]